MGNEVGMIEMAPAGICFDIGWKFANDDSRVFTGLVEQPVPNPPNYALFATDTVGLNDGLKRRRVASWRPSGAPACPDTPMTRLVQVGDMEAICSRAIGEFHANLPPDWGTWAFGGLGYPAELFVSADGNWEKIWRWQMFYRVSRTFLNNIRGFFIDSSFSFDYSLIDSEGGPFPGFGGWLTYNQSGSTTMPFGTQIDGETTPSAANPYAAGLIALAAVHSNEIFMSTDNESTITPNNLGNATFGLLPQVQVGWGTSVNGPLTAPTLEESTPGAAYFEGNHGPGDWGALIAAYNAA